MTYRELLYKAQRLIGNNEITLGEYDEMTKPLNEEVRQVGEWIRKPIRNDKGGCIGAEMICSCCYKDNRHDEYMDFCPNCGAKMKGE
jgi:hypothetical protein